jgi:farnesyl diphosphate synthase
VTLVAALGAAGARARLDELVTQADAALAPFAAKADTLRAAARFVATRRR